MSDNAGLTDEQKEINRLKWLLIEGCARADIATTTGAVLSMAKHVRDMAWLSDFEKDMTTNG